ncbi:MAG TPA: tRNA (guanosine(37)-N1)-methyltransferase TrmD [Gammaproteobacteria bacterium]|nr:tRNA (guanosine(37)-N1)-methyltransferase TrmD [Gammaproteobacteria bacterium]
MFTFGVVALFPELVEPVTRYGVVGRARERGLIALEQMSPRDFTADRHRTVDDRPYGGGPGMVLKYEPLRDAIRALRERMPSGSAEFVLSAQGRPLDQRLAAELASRPGLLLVAGRYEGIDERIVVGEVRAELSLGDYVLSGGEPAAAVVIDAVTRLLPGVLGHVDSSAEDSYAAGLLDCPQYTRPEEADGMRVPEVLLTGDHGAVRRWRLKQALGRTWLRRPRLLEARVLGPEESELLEEFKRELAEAGPRNEIA